MKEIEDDLNNLPSIYPKGEKGPLKLSDIKDLDMPHHEEWDPASNRDFETSGESKLLDILKDKSVKTLVGYSVCMEVVLMGMSAPKLGTKKHWRSKSCSKRSVRGRSWKNWRKSKERND